LIFSLIAVVKFLYYYIKKNGSSRFEDYQPY